MFCRQEGMGQLSHSHSCERLTFEDLRLGELDDLVHGLVERHVAVLGEEELEEGRPGDEGVVDDGQAGVSVL